jgi:hypothetical protein
VGLFALLALLAWPGGRGPRAAAAEPRSAEGRSAERIGGWSPAAALTLPLTSSSSMDRSVRGALAAHHASVGDGG